MSDWPPPPSLRNYTVTALIGILSASIAYFVSQGNLLVALIVCVLIGIALRPLRSRLYPPPPPADLCGDEQPVEP